jgi:hypothetical protein
MKPIHLLRAAALTLSSAGLLLPQSRVLAATVETPAPAVDPAAPMVLDVALAEGGLLLGQVVDPQGQPVADAPVAVLYQGKEVAKTTSDATGNFAVSGLKGGAHVVQSGEHGGICRMWSPQTAPPSANRQVLLVKGSQVARGQGFFSPGGLLMLTGVGLIVAAGVISQENSGNGNDGAGSS